MKLDFSDIGATLIALGQTMIETPGVCLGALIDDPESCDDIIANFDADFDDEKATEIVEWLADNNPNNVQLLVLTCEEIDLPD